MLRANVYQRSRLVKRIRLGNLAIKSESRGIAAVCRKQTRQI